MNNVADTIPPSRYLSGGTAYGQSLLQAVDAAAARTLIGAAEPSANIPEPTGGTPDAEARTAINAILDLLIERGLMAAPE